MNDSIRARKPGEVWSGRVSWRRGFDRSQRVRVGRPRLPKQNRWRPDESQHNHLLKRLDGETIVFVMLRDDVCSGDLDLSRGADVCDQRFHRGRPSHCLIHLEIAQLMQRPRQKTDERNKKCHDSARAARMQISELARSGFHFAGGLTKSVSKSNMRNRWRRLRCSITMAPTISNDPTPTPSLSKRDHTPM